MAAPPPSPTPVANLEWQAPWPFHQIVRNGPGPGVPSVVVEEPSHSRSIFATLRALCNIGGTGLTVKSMINESHIGAALNIHNLALEDCMENPWTYVNPNLLDVPAFPTEEYVWENLNRRTKANAYDDRLIRDLEAPWTPVSSNPTRKARNVSRYRFYVFMHRHLPSNFNQQLGKSRVSIYSTTIWDRENQSSIWYDFWNEGHDQRRDAIRAFWNNVPLTWPAILTSTIGSRLAVRHHILALSQGGYAHANTPPGFTQFSMLGVILDHVNNGRTAPTPRYETAHDGAVLSAMDPRAAPLFIKVLIETVRAGDWQTTLVGDDDIAKDAWEEFRIMNTYLQREVRALLEARYNGTDDAWIVDAVAPPVMKI
ncbi:uncharacterized protein GGS25DRAFT_533285 [Hypoxylon fragiforme]|uniref:uncharacterized protein n=1 Tax=Hypoxylon fragiforme TaxID=63214 RepID=UPI0020C64A12|nr:uncharacterized protein GGS25DRAFT_533285 [Hypoxylon fragiforme]KAI2606177.1 hypothetical protein GGS25DRAFT_533285 [Hypoxylon fragiforme]